LKTSGSEFAREIAELRLSIGELRSSVRDAQRNSREVITENAKAAVPMVCSQMLLNAVAQIADGDESLQRTLNDSLSVIDSVEKLRQEAIEHQQVRH
jgi:ubiquinone biosynthesis protein UbiJ